MGMDMKVFGLACALLLFINSYSTAQIESSSDDRFEIAIVTRSLAQQGSATNTLIGVEATLFNKAHTFSLSAFALTNLYDFNQNNDDRPALGLASNSVFRNNFNTAGISFQQLLFEKNRVRLSAGTALSVNWFDETVRDLDLISYGPNGFTALEPTFSFSYLMSDRFVLKVTPSYLVAFGQDNGSAFEQFNIGAGLGIRF